MIHPHAHLDHFVQVKRVSHLHWGSESKLGWCHVQFEDNAHVEQALKVDLTEHFGCRSYGYYRSKISAWTFKELVPPWIVGPVQLTCTCWRCENGKLIWATAKRLLPLFDKKISEETAEEEEGSCQDLADLIKEAESVAVVDGIQLASSPDDVIRCCCCDPGECKHVVEACLTGSCQKCYPGLKRISNLYIKPESPTARKTVKVCIPLTHSIQLIHTYMNTHTNTLGHTCVGGGHSGGT